MIDYIRYHLRPEQEADFLEACRAAARHLDSCSHCRAYELARCANGAANYILRVEWSGSGGEVRDSPEFRAFFAAIQRYLSSAVEVAEYRRHNLAEKA